MMIVSRISAERLGLKRPDDEVRDEGEHGVVSEMHGDADKMERVHDQHEVGVSGVKKDEAGQAEWRCPPEVRNYGGR